MKKSIVILKNGKKIAEESINVEWTGYAEHVIANFVIGWCGNNGYSYDRENISWKYVSISASE